MSGVTVAVDALSAQGEPTYTLSGELVGWESDPRFVISSMTPEDSDPQMQQQILANIVAAVRIAGARFSYVDWQGQELEYWELGGDNYTPNYVSNPILIDEGVAIWADTKAGLSKRMGEKMIQILVEELSKANVDAHVSALPESADLSGGEILEEPELQAPDDDDALPSPKFWFITRTVRTKTTTGKEYWDVDYRRPDGTWTRSRDEAERFPESALEQINALCWKLRAEPNDETKYGSATGVLLGAHEDLSWLPPPHIRDGGEPD